MIDTASPRDESPLNQQLLALQLTMRRVIANRLRRYFTRPARAWLTRLDLELMLRDLDDDAKQVKRLLSWYAVLCSQTAPRTFSDIASFQLLELPVWIALRVREDRAWRSRGWLRP